MSRKKVVFNERLDIIDKNGTVKKSVALIVRWLGEQRELRTSVVSEERLNAYEMKFTNGAKVKSGRFYAASFEDIKGQFITMLQDVVDTRDPETTSVKLNPNNHHFKLSMAICPFCGRKLMKYYGVKRGIEIKCKRCGRISTAS